MRVLQLVKTSVGATWALRQMRELVKLGVAVHVLLPPGPLAPHYRAAGVVAHEYSSLTDLARKLERVIFNVRPDLIHSHFVNTTLLMRLILGRRHVLPRVFQVAGPLHLEHALFARTELMSAGPCDYWIAGCEWTQDRVRALGIAANRVFLAYPGVDVDEFDQRTPGRLRALLNLSPRQRIVGMVAYFYAPKPYLGQSRGLKGHEDLIEALQSVIREEPNVVGVFIGGAWGSTDRYQRRVETYARQLLGDKAIFLGTRADVADLYPDFEVAVHPSHSENVGGAVESLLSGIPTIGTSVGGIPDLVKNDETGWLVPPRDPARLASAILHALRSPAQARQLAQNGQSQARRQFDIRLNARDIYEIYQSILGGF